MKNTSALFIIDDVIANQLLELDDEYIGYQVLHEESFYKHLLDVQEFPVIDEYSNKESHKALLVIRSWQEVREILKEVQKEKNIKYIQKDMRARDGAGQDHENCDVNHDFHLGFNAYR